MTEKKLQKNSRDIYSMDDIQRLKDEYADRDSQREYKELYSFSNPSNLFAIQNRQRALMKLLRRYQLQDLSTSNVLEIGCGEGKIILEFFTLGAKLNIFHGVELIEHRVQMASELFPLSPILQGDARYLPYQDGSFDILLQYTVLSSILDEDNKKKISKEMLRVLRPNGVIIWYDFWLNPTNPHTKGVRKKEIQQLFPNCEFEFLKITLAPPLARKLVPIPWLVAQFLEKIGIFNTHYLVLIKPQ